MAMYPNTMGPFLALQPPPRLLASSFMQLDDIQVQPPPRLLGSRLMQLDDIHIQHVLTRPFPDAHMGKEYTEALSSPYNTERSIMVL
jgi:hypothetical protein